MTSTGISPAYGGLSKVANVRSMFCPLVATGFPPRGDPVGDDVLQFIRESMCRVLAVAFDEAGVGWTECHHEVRGDVVVIAVPPHVEPEVLLDQLITRLRAGLRLHNKLSSKIAQIRLRMAAHAGLLRFARTGMTGPALARLTDILNAPSFLHHADESAADLVVAASDYLYDELIQYGPGLIEPETYHPIKVPTAHAQTCAWVHIPR